MTNEYWIIDSEDEGVHAGSKTALGPFPSIKSAEKWLREDCETNFLDSDGSLRDSAELPWAEPMYIVEVIKKVRQVPSVKISVKLEEVSND